MKFKLRPDPEPLRQVFCIYKDTSCGLKAMYKTEKKRKKMNKKG